MKKYIKKSKVQKIAEENGLTVNEVLISVGKNCKNYFQASELLGFKDGGFLSYLTRINTNWSKLKNRAIHAKEVVDVYTIVGINLEALQDKPMVLKVVHMNRTIRHCNKCGSLVKYMWSGVMWCIAAGHTFYAEDVLKGG